jgi:hypothetical protein
MFKNHNQMPIPMPILMLPLPIPRLPLPNEQMPALPLLGATIV